MFWTGCLGPRPVTVRLTGGVFRLTGPDWMFWTGCLGVTKGVAADCGVFQAVAPGRAVALGRVLLSILNRA